MKSRAIFIIVFLKGDLNMANRCNQVMYDFTKILFRKMEKARLSVLFDAFSFLSDKEKKPF